MNTINDLLQQYCSMGVEYKTLKDVSRIEKGQQLNKSSLKDKAKYPVMNGGILPSGYWNEYNTESDTIIISQGGASAGYTQFMTMRFWAGAHCFVVKPQGILNKYLYYVIKKYQNILMHNQYGVGIPALSKETLQALQIPLPPMPIQQEIVRILDKYSEFENKLEIKLQEEIDTRKKQYEYYRNRLLSFYSYTIKTKKIQMKPLSEVVCICNGKDHKHLKKGVYPVYGSGGIIRYVDTYIYNDVSVLIPRKGSVGNIFYITTPFWTVDTIFFTKINKDLVEPKYLYYFLLNQHLEKMNLAVGVPSLTKMMLNKIVVAVPSLEEQRKIVELLDNYTSLEKELEIKLQEEIDNRKKQYEYYRNKLLTFSPKLKEDD